MYIYIYKRFYLLQGWTATTKHVSREYTDWRVYVDWQTTY